MAEQTYTALARLVSMVHVIDERPGITIEELADRFGRTKRAIRNDIETLDRAGVDDLLPGNTFEIDYDLYLEEGRLALRTPLQLSAPLPLTTAELARLSTGLAALAPLLREEELQVLPHALSLLLPMAGSQGTDVEDDFAALTTSVANPLRNRINLVEQAIEAEELLRFDYRDAKGRRSKRLLRPRQVELGRDGWVVNGYCLATEGERNFRLDRMGNLAATPEAAGEELSATEPSSNRTDPVMVEVILEPEAQWVLNESSATELTVLGDGTIRAVFGVWDDDWFRTELLLLAPWVRSTTPDDYLLNAAAFAQTAEAARAAAPLELNSQGDAQ